MVTKAEVTEYIDAQFVGEEGDANHIFWREQQHFVEKFYVGNRLSVIQEWMSPEVATILQKLIGEASMVKKIAKNRSNSS